MSTEPHLLIPPCRYQSLQGMPPVLDFEAPDLLLGTLACPRALLLLALACPLTLACLLALPWVPEVNHLFPGLCRTSISITGSLLFGKRCIDVRACACTEVLLPHDQHLPHSLPILYPSLPMANSSLLILMLVLLL